MTQKLYILTLLLTFGLSECIEGDCKDGAGTFTSLDGLKYVGEFKNGIYHGQGTFTFSDGRKYIGEWKDGERVGWGILTKPDGTSQIGIWFNDNFVEEKIFTEVIKYLKAKYPDSKILEDY